MIQLRSYLTKVKGLIYSETVDTSYKIVTGNQSADLDSVVSAITYAFAEHLYSNSIVIPLINIPRADFKLRRDIVTLLERNSIDECLLVFLEDFAHIMKQTSSQWGMRLVDHCNLQGKEIIESYQNGKVKVEAIIDHHADEGAFLDSSPRIIKASGSCSSLVFNYWYKLLKDEKEKQITFSSTSALSLGPLLIDTSNMTSRVEQDDVIAYETYKQILKSITPLNEEKAGNGVHSQEISFKDASFMSLYKDIKEAKKNVDGFSFHDILRKDYKQFEFFTSSKTPINVGFSSISKSFKWIFTSYSTEQLKSAMREFFVENKLDLHIVTSSFSHQNKYYREFLYYYKPESKFASSMENLNNAASKLSLNDDIFQEVAFHEKLQNLKSSENVFLYNQGNTDGNRKFIVPVIKSIIERYE